MTVYVRGLDDDEVGHGEIVNLRKVFSRGLIVSNGIVFRSMERYKSDGARDTSRCRYFMNGRKVKHAKYQRALRASGIF